MSDRTAYAATTRLKRAVPSSRMRNGFSLGDVLGDMYELRELLAAHDDYEFFGAYDRVLGRDVAIKIVTGSTPRDNLRREARMLAPLTHPGIATVYGYGSSGSAEYLVTERVHGTTLGEFRELLAARGGLATSEAISILLGIAEALAAMHANGYVHGRLTANAVVLASDGRIVLRDPMIVGEVVPGESGDASTDMTALGFLAYQLFTGTVWAGEQIHAVAMPDEASRILGELLPADDRKPPTAVDVATSLRATRRGVESGRPLAIADDEDTALRTAVSHARVHLAADGVEATPAATSTLIGGRYELGRQLGRGGMGVVHEARHHQLGRPLALKMISPQYALDAAARARFLQEARLASEIVHPNIVSVIDYGEDRHVGSYMVMELMHGDSLSEHAKNKMSLRRACDMLGQVADALTQIHARGIVHGDIKAENIVVVEELVGTRRRRLAKLIDFGLARRVTSMNATSDVITGTPHYIAPERAAGAQATVASDVYALGILGYLLLAGSLPFEGTATEIMVAHVKRQPAPLAERRGEPVDSALQTLISRALSKDVAQRHPTAAAFRYELNNALDMLELSNRNARVAARGSL